MNLGRNAFKAGSFWLRPWKPALLVAAAAITLVLAQSSSVTTLKGQLRIEHWTAESLEDNLLGETADFSATIYLPPGYDQSSQRYPVIYLLAGIFDRADVWVDHFKVHEILDELIEADTLPPLIMAFVGGRNRLGGGFYRDSPVSGNWGRLISEELVSRIDSRYRTLNRRNSRAIAGHSMGGYGALYAVMEHPQVFSSAYAMSPCCLAPVEDLGQGNPVWTRIAALSNWTQVAEAADQRDFYLVAGLGILTAFMPNPEAPPFFVDVPFAKKRGETVVVEPEFSRWTAEFPLALLPHRKDALLSLRGLALDYGIYDQFAHIPVGAQLFSEKLSRMRIPHRYEAYKGDHREQLKERLRAIVIPYLARHLDSATAPPTGGSPGQPH